MADKDKHIAFSGGPERAFFIVNGARFSQNQMVNLLLQHGYEHVLQKSHKRTELILIPDSVQEASKSTLARAPTAKTEKWSEFIKRNPSFAQEKPKPTTTRGRNKKNSAVRLSLKLGEDKESKIRISTGKDQHVDFSVSSNSSEQVQIVHSKTKREIVIRY